MNASAATTAFADNFGVFDNSTSGNLLFYGALAVPKTVSVGDEIRFNASSLTIRID
jgi:hypothetical protein